MWRGWSLRARTTVAATAALAPLLLLAGTTGVWVQRADLTAGVSALAEQQARNLASDVPDDAPAGGVEGSIVQVVSLTTGAVESGPPGVGALAPAPPGAAPAHGRTRDPRPGEQDRYETVALRSNDASTYVVVALSLESVDAATSSTSALLAIGGLLVLLMTAALTWWTTGRALSPVEAMRGRAELISGADLTQRLPVPPSQDELARLATTLNALLERVDVASRAERQFVADASHELRSPVATIRALLESDRLRPHPGGHAGLTHDVIEETERLTALIDDLLRLARGDARLPTQHAPVDISAVLVTEAARARRRPVKSTIAHGLDVRGDAEALAVAIRNLLDNAERHAVSTIDITAALDGQHVIIAVTDDGPGVPISEGERIFERFVRLDDSRNRSEGGTGLGLAITRQIVTSHHGSVHLSGSTPGAQFVITLPLAR